MAQNRIYVGTSGWHYRHWIGTFYPRETKASEQLAYYVNNFNTVELNNPFYRLPSKETFLRWRKTVPDDFLFSVKASRFITHMKKLKDPEESLKQFLDHASGLKEKLGPILFQLPPGWGVNADRLKEFLRALPKKFSYVFEFRNTTWYAPEIISLLKEYNCAFCIYELAGHITPLEVTANFVYVRLHGPGNKYQGSYTAKDLRLWHKRSLEWLDQKKDVFIYFDNDQAGYAAQNAADLLKLISRSKK
jgi:uncharacterized protein YecE (DUF72 family)